MSDPELRTTSAMASVLEALTNDVTAQMQALVAEQSEQLKKLLEKAEYSPSWQPGYGSGTIMRNYLGQLTLGKLNLELLNNEYIVISSGPTNADSTPRWKKMKSWLEEKLPEETPSERLYLI